MVDDSLDGPPLGALWVSIILLSAVCSQSPRALLRLFTSHLAPRSLLASRLIASTSVPGRTKQALQHVTVNADGLGLCPAEIKCRMAAGGFDESKVETMEMIHGLTKLMIAHK